MSGTSIYQFLRLFLPALVLILLVGVFYAITIINHEQHQIQSHEQEAVRLAANALRQQLRDAASDVIYLAHLPRLRIALVHPSLLNLREVAADFSAYMNAKGKIDQIRWLDQTGMERIRVNYVNGHAKIVAKQALQDKSKRPYFTKTVGLPSGAIYVSPLELNIEHGHIEVPNKPVLRIAIPIIDNNSLRRGILVVNYIGNRLIRTFTESSDNKFYHLMLLNHNGYWLHGTQAEGNWGFMTGKMPQFIKRYKKAWFVINSSKQGNILLTSGLWIWKSIYPLNEIKKGIKLDMGKSPVVVANPGFIWKAVIRLSPNISNNIRLKVWYFIGLVMAALILIAAFICAWASRSLTRISMLNIKLRERADAAEIASRAKENFLANMSHEIRTPLNAILGLASLLIKTELSEESKELVRKVRSAGRLLLGIINDILDFSKIEAGRLEIEHEPFLLGDILDNISTVMATTAGDKDLELVISPASTNLGELLGDALRLEQILINLTSNAIKFTDHGIVEVKITIEEENKKNVRLRFSVCDTGMGIAPERQKELFSPFVQMDASTTRRFGGTGLGLAISQRLVYLLDGEIGVNSDIGKGSEFWFTVNFERTDSISLSVPAMANLNVLIAEDNPVTRSALRATAESLGWKSIIVKSGEDAIEYVQNWQSNDDSKMAIVLDWKMSGIDGLTTANRIREITGENKHPIVIMTNAYLHDDLLSSSYGSLADAVLDKPVTPSSLFDAVIKALHIRNSCILPSIQQVSDYRLSGIRILVVDDSDINREVAKQIFVSEGAQVHLANNGRQAIEWLNYNQDNIDLVLMDIQMPVMDGFEATRYIRNDSKLSKLPVVALTAGAFKSQQDEALNSGITEYIAKPFDIDATVMLIRKLVSQENLQKRNITLEDVTSKVSSKSPQQSTVSEKNESFIFAGIDSQPHKYVNPISAFNHESDTDDDCEYIFQSDSKNKEVFFLPGVDTEDGLKRLNGDKTVYLRILNSFRNKQADVAKRIEILIQKKDWIKAAHLAHTLKGISGNIGAKCLYKNAGFLEKSCYQEDTKRSMEWLSQTRISLKEVIDGLAAQEEITPRLKQKITETTKINYTEISDLLKFILHFLDTDIGMAQYYVDKLQQCDLNNEMAATAMTLEKALNAFDIEMAKTVAQHFIATQIKQYSEKFY